MASDKKPLKVGIFADDIDRKGMGTAVVLRHLLEEYLSYFGGDLDLYLIHREGGCRHSLCARAKTLPIKILSLPKFAGFFSLLYFFIFTKERFDVVHFPRPALHLGFWLLKALKKTKKIAVTFHGAPESGIPIFQTLATRFNRRFIACFGKYFIDAAIVDCRAAVGQVASYYRITERKITAIYLGVDSAFRLLDAEEKKAAAAKIKNRYQIAPPYILAVGRFDPHKNIHRLAEAFGKLTARPDFTHRLVLVGGPHEPRYSALVKKTIADSGIIDRVLVVPFIEDEDLPAVYALADLSVFVSLSEGFGMPILESMACGTPVITSGISAMPEIAGGAALLVDSYDVEKIAEAIWWLLNDEKMRADLKKRGGERVKEFSWRKTAAENINLYKKILGL